jgi:hypothetical protein
MRTILPAAPPRKSARRHRQTSDHNQSKRVISVSEYGKHRMRAAVVLY